jgi:thiol:disulfide interchange protein DsbD
MLLTCALLGSAVAASGAVPVPVAASEPTPGAFSGRLTDDTPPVAAPATEGVVTVQLLPDITRWVPGRQHLVGVHFEMEPGWHLYWQGQNDSGLPIQVTQLTDGDEAPLHLAAGPLRWPPPQRLVHEGDLVDHVYHDAVTLLLPVTVAADAEPGTRLTLRVNADWLVCEEACLPGSAEVSLTMTVAVPEESPARTESADQLGAVLARIPTSLAEDVTIEPLADEPDTYQVTVPNAQALAFYPAEDGLVLTDIASSCAAMGPRLFIHADPDPPYRPEADGPARLRGVLEAWYETDEPTRLSLVDLPGPQHASTTPGEQP